MFTDRPVPSAGPLLDQLLQALRAEPLSRKVHWLRLFIAYNHGQLQANEVLLDSEAPVSEERVAVRIFGLLVPDNDVAFQ
jgi:hypothetical protein